MPTLSVIKADVGGFVGHSAVHPDLVALACNHLAQARQRGLLLDYHVATCGDDLFLMMTHTQGEEATAIHGLAWDTFRSTTELARSLKMYGAGQDLLKDAFSGNVRGLGPGCAEMTFAERASEPVVVVMADKTAAGAFNLPLYKIFADPFNTVGLVISELLHGGFVFELVDVVEGRSITLQAPEELYDLLLFVGAPGRYAVKRVLTRPGGEVAAVCSTERLSQLAGRYVGKDDPVLVVRCQGAFPAVGEVLEPFAHPWLVQGWMRGSHHGPLMPVAQYAAHPSRFDGPPRAVALGFQICDGRFVGPRDLFDDPGFDRARAKANEMADYLRSMGPFEPHRLGLDSMEYTVSPKVTARLAPRWQPLRKTLQPVLSEGEDVATEPSRQGGSIA